MNAKPEIRYSACPHDCPSTCALEVEKLDSWTIGRVRGARDNAYTAGVVCGKVARYAERIHHPDRLLYPQRRVGDKGSDDFMPISWDDALDEVSEALLKAEQRYGSETVWHYYYAGTMGFVMRDGSGQMGLYGRPPTDVAYREGPIDPELGVVSFTSESLRPIALLLHHTCNAVHDFPMRCVTADWPGAWSSRIRAMYGDDCVPLVICGCGANIDHSDPLNPSHIDTTERMGAILAEATVPVLEELARAVQGRRLSLIHI